MTNRDVIELKMAGLSDEFAIGKIQRSPVGYQLDTNDIVALKNSSVSEAVIQAMMAAASPVPQQPSGLPNPAISTPQTPPSPIPIRPLLTLRPSPRNRRPIQRQGLLPTHPKKVCGRN